ncbi:MAG: YjbH domain-containing protein, partial [SAR92 clade bacterium]|nr:YjbH domain-containing protein [SAR92 clade bacterium]
MTLRLIILFLLAFLPVQLLLSSDEIYGLEEFALSSNSSGGTGLIQNPTARFSDDGELSFGLSVASPFNRIYAKIQFFPWLESSVRYTENTTVPYNPGSRQTWKDKGIDIKLRLLKEGKYKPQIALGLLDFGGTGAYAGEYIVANKRLQNIDFSLGIGWGRLAGNGQIDNPFANLSDSYNIRGGNKSTGLGGTIGFSRFFTGEKAGIFGGIEYFTPIPNLSLKIEYDGDDYDREIGKKLLFNDNEEEDLFNVDSPINIGINYRLNLYDRDKLDLQMGIERGNTFFLNASLHSNLNFEGKQKYTAPKEILNQPYLAPFGELDDGWKKYQSELIMWQMGNVGIVTHSIIFQGNELQAEISQSRFREPIKAIDLAMRILGNNSPKNIDKITVINVDNG